ncbi:hypothetical protein FRP1_02200 [Pseudonocardia sp. EC080625-04]|uniref:hypothetical protein n=1 Tax=Pseudonocardia sp. EC080625-04 TaxID=1096868 RepID=UPI0006CB34C5|nr:hypothetical protein [Pseudonocardia sp. EC080625-04]ALE72250.1 hypothetical protein FRP1_02200 [Pseudonocardia sp. EC080625-04]
MTDTPAGAPLPGAPGAPGAPGHREVVSVAELLARHAAGARDSRPGPLTGPILSVGDLLRREGRESAAAVPASDVPAAGAPGGWPDIDLPQPRTEGAQGWAARPTSGRRRAGAVAGALVAAGSVLGAAMYNGAASHDSDAQAAADGLFPGVALPAGQAPDTLPGQYLPANVALSSPLHELPGTAPGATDWMDVAFPQQSAAAGTLRQVSTGTGSGAAAAIPAQRTTTTAAATPPAGSPGTPSGDGPTGTGSTGTGSPIGGLAPVQALNNPDRPSAPNLIAPLTTPSPSADGTSTGPLQGVTEPVRPAVAGVADGVVAPVARAAGPVGRTVGGALEPVTGAVAPVTDAVKPVTRPLTDTLEPVTTPVLGALSPVTEPVLGATEPLTGPVLKAAEPVTGLLDTSAATKKTDGSSGSSGNERTQPLQKVTAPVGKALGTVTEPVGKAASTVTEPVGGLVGGVTEGAGSLLGG